MLKRSIKKAFRLLGFEIRKAQKEKIYKHVNEDMYDGLVRSYLRGQQLVNTIVDIGAAEGSWSLSAREVWPKASFVLFEPLIERKELLNNLVNSTSNFFFIPKAAGNKENTISFKVSDDLDGSGVASQGENNNNVRIVEVVSIEEELKSLKLTGPFIIKLDTHGFEVPIIEGCSTIMDQVSMFIIECYGFQIADNSLLFWEMCEYMDKKGFRLIDIIDVVRRPVDEAFWQCDAFFIPKNSSIFQRNSYKTSENE